MMRNIMSIVFILTSVFGLFADEAETYSSAIEMAANLNKPILIDFWRDN
jgi:hypothetical protein